MPLKINVTFAEAGPGWSETYYSSLGNPSDYIKYVGSGDLDPTCPAGRFRTIRKGCLTATAAVQHIRASLVGSPQITLSHYSSAIAGAGTYTPETGRNPHSAEVFAKLLIRMQCGQTKRRSLWLGGLPEEVVTGPQTYTPNNTWNSALGTFTDHLATTTYGIVGRLPALGPPVAQAISSFVTMPSSLGVTIQPVPTNAPNGAYGYVVIRGLKYPRGWNGVHRAYFNLLGTSFQIGPTRETQHTVPVWDIGSGGTVQLLTYNLTPFTSGFPEYITHRKVGRPFGESRGRLAFR
jgi:hypothetical protein